MAWSPDGALLAVAGSAGIYVYDAATWEEVRFIESEAWVNAIAFSPDGRTIAAGQRDDTVRLWEVSTGQALLRFEGHTGQVNSIAFSPDRRLLASGGEDTTIRVWDVEVGQLLYTLEESTSVVGSVSFSPDGLMLAAGSPLGAWLWEATTGQLLRTFEASDGTLLVAFSPDGQTIWTTGGYVAHVWEVSTGERLSTLDPYASQLALCSLIVGLAISPVERGRTVIVGCEDDVAYVFDATTLQPQYWFKGTGPHFLPPGGHIVDGSQIASIGPGFAFSPDGRRLASAGGATVSLTDIDTGRTLRMLRGYTPPLSDIAFSPDGSVLAVSGNNYPVQARLWETTGSSSLWRTFESEEVADEIIRVAFGPDGRLFVTGGHEGLTMWDTRTGQIVRTLERYAYLDESGDLAFNPDGRTLASGDDDGVIQAWEVSTGETLLTLTGHEGSVFGVTYSRDGRVLASGGEDKTVRVWEAGTGQLLRVLEGHTAPVLRVTFSPDGRVLASGDAEGQVRLWELSTGQLLYELDAGGSSVAFNRDGRLLATGGDAVRLWDPTTGRLLHELKGDAVVVAFSPYGRLLAAGSERGLVRLWGLSD